MINKKEIIGFILLFLIIYIIIYADHKINNKCNCDDCYLSSNVSVKIPIISSIIGLIIYKIAEPHIYAYMCSFSIVKQNIITEMVDF